jgi:hypothetical protein
MIEEYFHQKDETEFRPDIQRFTEIGEDSRQDMQFMGTYLRKSTHWKFSGKGLSYTQVKLHDRITVEETGYNNSYVRLREITSVLSQWFDLKNLDFLVKLIHNTIKHRRETNRSCYIFRDDHDRFALLLACLDIMLEPKHLYITPEVLDEINGELMRLGLLFVANVQDKWKDKTRSNNQQAITFGDLFRWRKRVRKYDLGFYSFFTHEKMGADPLMFLNRLSYNLLYMQTKGLKSEVLSQISRLARHKALSFTDHPDFMRTRKVTFDVWLQSIISDAFNEVTGLEGVPFPNKNLLTTKRSLVRVKLEQVRFIHFFKSLFHQVKIDLPREQVESLYNRTEKSAWNLIMGLPKSKTKRSRIACQEWDCWVYALILNEWQELFPTNEALGLFPEKRDQILQKLEKIRKYNQSQKKREHQEAELQKSVLHSPNRCARKWKAPIKRKKKTSDLTPLYIPI